MFSDRILKSLVFIDLSNENVRSKKTIIKKLRFMYIQYLMNLNFLISLKKSKIVLVFR
jgi:NurA-like 5'-3' nuclease